jgi:radical SAM protein with 4Fe4S-binding SPASM domain
VAQEQEMRDIFREHLPDELKVVPSHSWAGQYQEFVRYRENVGHLDKLSICHMPWDRMAITWDGNVVGCCNDFLAKYINGNVARQPVLEVWNSPAYQRLRRSIHQKDYASLEVCKGCDVPWAGDEPMPLWKRQAASVLSNGLVAWRKATGRTAPRPGAQDAAPQANGQ